MTNYKRVFAKPCKYKKTIFRSHFERDFAKFMDRNKIKWEYEKHKFELLSKEQYYDKTDGKIHTLRNVLFIPDFYLPEYNLIVEIKGYPYDDRLFHLKLRLFKHKYPDRSILVIKSREEFKNLKEILSKMDSESENEYYHNGYYENFKKYTSRDEFLNDDDFTDEEKTEICEAIFEAETEREL